MFDMRYVNLTNFNSIKVQLKQAHTLCPYHSAHPDFNSIKVQLKPQAIIDLYGLAKFQFHKGTIKALSLPRNKLYYSVISIP